MMARRAQRGVALLEAMIACVILAIGLLGTIGLQARAYSAMNDAGTRAEAVIASDKLFGMMSTDIANLNSYAVAAGAQPGAALALWYADTMHAIPGATISVVMAAAPTGNSTAVTITIAWKRKPTDVNGNQNVVTSYLAGST
jgi:type IV pilus assembly protein PilV